MRSPQLSVYRCEQPGLRAGSRFFAPSSICQSISRCNDIGSFRERSEPRRVWSHLILLSFVETPFQFRKLHCSTGRALPERNRYRCGPAKTPERLGRWYQYDSQALARVLSASTGHGSSSAQFRSPDDGQSPRSTRKCIGKSMAITGEWVMVGEARVILARENGSDANDLDTSRAVAPEYGQMRSDVLDLDPIGSGSSADCFLPSRNHGEPPGSSALCLGKFAIRPSELDCGLGPLAGDTAQTERGLERLCWRRRPQEHDPL